jgi:glycosyltransferase involved in cell wall biosynthesis
MPSTKASVLQVSKLYHPWIGGVEKVVQDIAEGLNAEVEMRVLTCQPVGRGEHTSINEVEVIRARSLGMCFGMPVSLSFPFLLARWLRRASIVHMHLPFPLGVLSYLVFRFVRRKARLVITYHSDIVRQRRFLRFYTPFLRALLGRADRILVTSPNLLKSSPFLEPFEKKCQVIPLSIDLKRFGVREYEGDTLRKSDDERIVLFVGRLNYYKGLTYLIRAMQWVEGRLYIVGDGELRRELEDEAHSLGVEGRVEFVGALPDAELGRFYQACDVFVLPSVESSEAFGIVQLEAMAYGKPVVNTNLPTGVPFVSRHGDTGLTVEPRNPDELAEAINTILDDKKLAARFSQNAKTRVREEFDRPRMIERVRAVYDELADGPWHG